MLDFGRPRLFSYPNAAGFFLAKNMRPERQHTRQASICFNLATYTLLSPVLLCFMNVDRF